jgi:hypothetical protein
VTGARNYDVSLVDGRFLTVNVPEAEREEGMTIVSVVLEWTPELERLVPAKP